jgi:hypothetical protein
MVDDVWGESQVSAKEECCLGEENEPLRIVKIIPFGSAIEIFPIVKLFSADKIDWDFFVKLTLIKIDLNGFPSYGDLHFFP